MFDEVLPDKSQPGIWSGEFAINKLGDLYLNVSQWGKRVVD